MNSKGKLLIQEKKIIENDKVKYYIFKKKNIFFLFIIILQQVLILVFSNYYVNYIHTKDYNYNYRSKLKLDYENNIFVIVRRPCKMGGLFSFYKVFLSCIIKFIIKGYIPILEVESYPTIFNGFKVNSSSVNSWEILFYQPYNYTLENVLKKAKNIKYFNCRKEHITPQYDDFYNKTIAINFWHNIAKNYIPIKNEIIKEAYNYKRRLFKGSNNILGVLIRGTDYLAKKPKNHPIPPSPELIFQDIKKMDKQYQYNWVFIVTEDNIIREKFIKNLKKKIRYILPNKYINYNYGKKKYLAFNKNIKGNLDNIKIYLINIIILSKCTDIIASRTNGLVGTFILTEGFRNKKVYYLGLYR